MTSREHADKIRVGTSPFPELVAIRVFSPEDRRPRTEGYIWSKRCLINAAR